MMQRIIAVDAMELQFTIIKLFSIYVISDAMCSYGKVPFRGLPPLDN